MVLHLNLLSSITLSLQTPGETDILDFHVDSCALKIHYDYNKRRWGEKKQTNKITRHRHHVTVEISLVLLLFNDKKHFYFY